MALNVRRIPFPDQLLVTDYSITLNQEGISEDGEPISAFNGTGRCMFSEKAKRFINSEGKQITLLGRVIVKGDIAPELKTIADGSITINNRTYEIHTGSRPRNPDGSIFSSNFEVK